MIDDDAAEGSTTHDVAPRADVADRDPRGTGGRKKWTRAQKKEKRGANKGRKFGKVHDQLELCWKVANGKVCEHGDECVLPVLVRSARSSHAWCRCRFTHDVEAYLAAKPRDIRFPSIVDVVNVSPFVVGAEEDDPAVPHVSSLDHRTTCPSFAESGVCRLGLKCRFLGAHAKDIAGEITLVEDVEKKAHTALSATELNFVSAETLKLLRTKKVRQRSRVFSP